MYGILFSDDVFNYLFKLNIINNNYDSMWFVSNNIDLITNIMNYFENLNRDDKLLYSIMINNKFNNIIHKKLFQIIIIDNIDVNNVNNIDNKIDINKIIYYGLVNFICLEGICNVENINSQRKYHIKHYDNKLLNSVRCYFINDNII